MRCLKRYIAREIYRVMRNPRPVPLTNDLCPQRRAHHITLTTAAQQLSVWPSTISRIEHGRSRDHALTERYPTWLEEQAKIRA